MAGNFFINEPPNQEAELFNLVDTHQPVSKWEGMMAAYTSGFRTNFLSMAIDKTRSVLTKANNGFDPMTPEQANEEFNPRVPFTEQIDRIDAQIRVQRERVLMEAEAIRQQSGLGGFGTFVSSFAGAASDPAMLFASTAAARLGGTIASNIVKSGTSIKFNRMLQSLSKSKFGDSIAKELAENLAIAAALEVPLAENLESVYGENVGFKEHAFNVAVGTAVGTLGRFIGRAYTSRKGKPGAVDQDRTTAIVAREVDESLHKGEAPDTEAALKRDRDSIVKHSNDNTNLKRVSDVVEESAPTSGIFYSTHNTEGGSAVDSQIRYGTPLGDGVYMVSNPALAEAKGLHAPEVSIVKYETSGLKLLNIDDELAPDVSIMAEFREFLANNVGNTKALKDMLKQTNIKNMLEIVDELNEGAPDSLLQKRVNAFFGERDVDGFRYKEDFFDGDVGDAIFIIRPSDEFNSSFIKEYKSNSKNRAEPIDTEAPEIEDVNSVLSKENNEFPKNDPVYSGDEGLERAFRETFDPALRDAPDTDAKAFNDSINEIMEDAKELITQLEEAGEPTAKLKKILEEGSDDLKTVEKIIRQNTICGNRNG